MSKGITTKNATSKEVAPSKKVKEIKGNEYVSVKFLKDHGTNEKGNEDVMHITTAEALEVHGIIEFL
jgi:hypothetical protein